MTDFADLLKVAAGSPPRPLDMAAVQQLAARRGLRRLALWLGLGVATVGIGGPFGAAVLSPADRGAEVGVVNTREAAEGTSPGGDSAQAPEVVTPDMSHREGNVAQAGDTAGASASAADRPSTGNPLPTADYPPATHCSVDNALLANGQKRTCRFTATTPGGWNIYEPPGHYPASARDAPVVTVTVTRDGASSTYRSRFVPNINGSGGAYFEGCADNVIERGDLVEVTITQSPSAVVPTQMGAGAGEGWGCAEPGPRPGP